MTHWIETEAELETHYGTPRLAAVAKVSARITPDYRAMIEASPFCALASVGPEGLDCSPRGDDGPVVLVEDDTTLVMPDRLGNNRIDSLRNIVRDPRVALMFLIPGSGVVMRVNGRARITADEAMCARYARDGKPPRSVVVVTVGEVYFQCTKAVVRSGLWQGRDMTEGLPTMGALVASATKNEIDADTFDAEWPAAAKATLW
ncbi:pyridoxamine 5'-phosphate oxidase family protein [Acuticoccus sp. MNP-M23]|uniref:MSMEG_1061 family FMN-dependent PPOX-type flavoprotein n=1 Tax=Acuticoccus sp. MNP-M23 TaxID=3072793 RepID=UPI002815C639|nr:MSMEG_1061 family FMN-dependent PPOX-type flavoprotein [Acuticoccus sp. MNP-M23]WMS43643.1 pyridoxamine 5'-phosphate oxidase family protein [Acuticoccus sp. MNP-M23]